MLLLKLTLVILISAIGERTMCSDSGPALQAKEKEKELESLLQGSLITESSDGCTYQLLPYFENEMDNGFLYVNCTKSCPEGQHETAVTGNECVVTATPSKNDEVDVTVGSCDGGSCKPGSKHITVSLSDDEEEEEAWDFLELAFCKGKIPHHHYYIHY
ncbi:uncharacterized protein LOC120848698 [Ixodes scapularis]|uniref:uncharacterized protein LOC120848698 n=1 Tax=Ixodes scapularis TaxID=6945 RepID=UPI001A9F8FA9|nr:uncharacterized protein LOC120848698 [Ixodes scapularis]